ncbi:MAG: ornithine cyclodeaminase family protein [Deltaproteobacteria bacterium]|nr:ornithine cyclodeaminase family protein [Deltaproteobacteria bacterium]MBI3064930.1 ornithine cyclodeaminase family protein [Deltaproteobacteria bacterium]
MLLITDPEVRQVLNMRDCIDAMERAFAEEARGIAVNKPRSRYKVPPDLDKPGYMANIIAGAVPSSGVAALRYDSTIVQERLVAGSKRMDFPSPLKRSWGFVLLFSLQTGEPLALIHDFSLSAIRVGATTGIANRALAKTNAKVVGILGSGNEARTNLEAICAVRAIERVKVYSITKEHRDRFAEEMTELLNVEVQPVNSPEAVIKGSDIVMCATNASQPVFDGNWLEPGQLVTTIANTDGVHRRTEADATTMIRADFIVLNNKETSITNQQRELLDLIDSGKFGWDKVCELGQVLAGHHPGRTSQQQIIYYKSNTGVGIQFAAAGALIYEKCRERGLGRDLPSEWFGADLSEWMGKGFMPSP